MNVFEASGYVAAALVLSAFAMKTMLTLRYVAIASNVAFIIYSFIGDLHPILVLHGLLLPLNIYRTAEILRLIRDMKAVDGGDFNLHALLPFMTRQAFERGAVLFKKGDPANDMYYIVEGRIHVVEHDVVLEPGMLVGEISMFTPGKTRTATVECLTDSVLYGLSDRKVAELAFQDRRFGFHLLRLIAARLVSNLERNDPVPLPR